MTILNLTEKTFNVYYNFIIHTWWANKVGNESIVEFTERYFYAIIKYNFEQTIPETLTFKHEKYKNWFLLQCHSKWSDDSNTFYYEPYYEPGY
jgi:hypothetical protein